MSRTQFLGFLALLVLLLASACSSPSARRKLAFERADGHLAHGDVARALRVLGDFLEYAPSDPETTVRLARVEVEHGDAWSAYQRLEQLPESVRSVLRDDPEYLDVLTRSLVEAGSVARAVTMLRARSDARPLTDAEVDRLMERAAGQPDLVLGDLPDEWRAALGLKLVRVGEPLAARRELRALPADHPARRQLLEEILHAVLQRDGSTFVVDFLRDTPEIQEEPPSPWMLLARHCVFEASNAGGDAAAVERTFLRRYPDHPQRYDMLLSLARRETRSGRPAEGLALAAEAVALEPSRAAPLVEKALALDELGRQDEAVRVMELVLGVEPGNTIASGWLARRSEEDDAKAQGTSLRSLELRLDAGT